MQADAVYDSVMSTEQNISAVFKLLHNLRDEVGDLFFEAGELQPGIRFKAFGELYELPVAQISAFLFMQAGLWDSVKDAAAAPDPQAALLELARTAEPSVAITEENAYLVAVALVVLFNNLDAMAMFHMSMSELLERVEAGDDDALFRAVLIDPSVLQAKAVADRVSTAAMYDDRSFFDALSKSITQTKPSRPKSHLDETRLLMVLLKDAGELETMTDAEITDWAVNKIGVYPESVDPLSAIRDQRRKRNRAKGGPKS